MGGGRGGACCAKGGNSVRNRIVCWALTVCVLCAAVFPYPARAASEIARGGCGALNENDLVWTLDSTGLLAFTGSGDMKDYKLLRGEAYSTNGGRSQAANYTEAPWYEYKDRIISVVIPSGVTHIGANAFYGNLDREAAPNYRFDSLTDVTIENGAASIGEGAFARCVALEELNLPTDSLKSIGKNAFNGCAALPTCVVPDSVTEIGDGAFADCASLTLRVNDGSYAQKYASDNNLRYSLTNSDQTYVGSGACGADMRWTLDENGLLLFTGGGAMENYKSVRGDSYSFDGKNLYASRTDAPWYEYREQIRSAEFPDGVTRIGDYAFYGNPNQESAPNYRFDALAQLTLPAGLEAIGAYAFSRCEALPGLNLPYGVKEIGAGAFTDCIGLSSVHLPESLLSLGDSAFSGCLGLREVQLPESLTYIGKDVFKDCANLILYVYSDSYALQWAQENMVRCRITPKENISVEGVDVTPAAVSVAIGQTVALTATVKPSNARDAGIAWRSLDERVATVDGNGVVRGVAQGATKVMAVTSDGQKTASCDVTVTEQVRVRGVLLDKGRLGLAVGQSAALTATVLPENASNKTVLWSSSAPSVASVDDNGTVTMLSEGEAVISVVTADGAKKTFCSVTPPVAATGVRLDRTVMDLQIGDTGALSATVLPESATNPNVTWNSLDESIATVSQDGTVTAKKVGETYVSAISQDGLFVAVCRVNVHREMTKVEAVALNRASVDSLPVGASVTLTAMPLPADATNQDVSWISSNPEIAAVSANGVVTAAATGTALITAVTADGGYTASCTVTVPALNRTPDRLIVRSDSAIFVPKGAPLNLPGLTVEAVYGQESEIVTDYAVSGYRPDVLGQQQITISYQGKSANMGITVVEASLLSLSLIRLPDKLQYAAGESPNCDGMILSALYSNNTSVELAFSNGVMPQGATVTMTSASSDGRVSEIAVSYGDKVASFPVTVNASGGESVVEAPRMSIRNVAGGKSVELISLSGGEIRFTLDGSAPSASDASQRYSAPISLNETTVVKAIATVNGVSSAVTSSTIQVETLETPATNYEDNAQIPTGTTVTLESPDSGAMIYYTTDGTAPTVNSLRYGSGILVNQEMTIRAIAVKEGCRNSAVLVRRYRVFENSAASQGNATISIGSVASRAGDNLSAPVYIFTDAGEKVTDFSFTVEYDRRTFAYASITPTEGMPWDALMVSADPAGKAITIRYMASLSGAQSGGAMESGEMFSLNFRALDSAEDGQYALRVADSVMTVKTDGGTPLVSVTSGVVTLTGSHNSQLSGSVTFTNENQEEITNLQGGTEGISATFSLDAFTPDTPSENGFGATTVIVDVFLAVYDRQDMMVDLQVWNAPLTNMASVFMQSLRIPQDVEVGSIKLMILSEDMTPMMAANEL